MVQSAHCASQYSETHPRRIIGRRRLRLALLLYRLVALRVRVQRVDAGQHYCLGGKRDARKARVCARVGRVQNLDMQECPRQ